MKGTEKTKAVSRLDLKKQPELPPEMVNNSQHANYMKELDEFFYYLNKWHQANLGKITMGMSPAVIGTAFWAWLLQLAQSPGHLLALACYPGTHFDEFLARLLCEQQPAEGKDVRFHKENWQLMPWRFYAEAFLQIEEWWQHATRKVPGLFGRAERTVSFCIRQLLDALSPSNFVMTNPDLFYETIRSGGANLIQGTELAIEHAQRRLAGMPPPGAGKFKPGKNVAITPGKIVFSNHLIELIQYEPQTETVFKEPILILPAWIMKYYILDLSPGNSLVKWLVRQGHTVFIVSWRNPDEKDRDLGMDDYYRQGAMAAIDAVSDILPKIKIHLMGYCLGGTLAMITAAAMARDKDNRLKSLSLLAAQGDFTKAGELMLFINESEIAFLKNMMWEKGYLDPKHMAGSFQMLRTYDLIWSKMIDDYMTGKKRGMIDLLAWNADATRMPYKMHTEYLEKLFLKNEFAEGHFRVEDEIVAPKNVHVPIFAVSPEHDHIAPWESVYKVHLMMHSDITFVLTNGGHNAGIVSEPNHPGRFYYIRESKKNMPYLGPKKWISKAKRKDGSWWLAWHEWLVNKGSQRHVSPPHLDPSLPSAPGSYVMQK
ncbi:PHA/PHB synthase family protein [Fluoribacter gormanii]|uniref:Poly-beta-hydroxybutyrate polymerase n=1 Tax=Fluoribacter gormanii TaxID=464 RepID=A0A377GLM0_9GAMM|nr:PHA synthase [Fluoribacter gormanii]SIR20050.1 polyhydroxyalkanoate synthase [Fluoribacter gormanii]STO25463.1 Poly-beta-hydroxybutyrate polymerase [Fluoribacter gormanii]